MTENLLQKLEEKMMVLVTELEDLRKEVDRLRAENVSLRSDRENSANKLQYLVSLIDAVSHVEKTVVNISAAKSVLVEG